MRLDKSRVSIPFNREGISEPRSRNDGVRVGRRGKVSIPFNWEGISELASGLIWTFVGIWFPFPSTGKAFPNSKSRTASGTERFSFHSLQPGRHFRTEIYLKMTQDCMQSFHSLQPGRHFRTENRSCRSKRGIKVSIPFNREGISEHLREKYAKKVSSEVSIPFNREGISEQFIKWLLEPLSEVEFPFPSTGKAFPNTCRSVVRKDKGGKVMFPFPSTGKAFPN